MSKSEIHPAEAQGSNLLPPRHICLMAPNMAGGGAERVMITLCRALVKERNCKVDLVLLERRGELLPFIPGGVRLFILEHKLRSLIRGIRSLKVKLPHRVERCLNLPLPRGPDPLLIKRTANYIDAEKPDVILGCLAPAFITALLARKTTDHKPPIISSVHAFIEGSLRDWKLHLVKLLPESDLVHGVSKDLVKSLSEIGVAEEKLVAIYNPIWGESLIKRQRQPLDHPWFSRKDGAKTVISAGRLVPVKDWDVLLRAFRLLAKRRKARLIILGEGYMRPMLTETVRRLGIEEQALLPGFVENPLPWFVRSDLFVLSSRGEGLPTVLIEALACGCPVVSTDCPYGPREILQDGRFGKLVPLDDSGDNSGKADPEELAEAMEATLDNPPDPGELINRAKFFSEEQAIPQYKKMLGLPA